MAGCFVTTEQLVINFSLEVATEGSWVINLPDRCDRTMVVTIDIFGRYWEIWLLVYFQMNETCMRGVFHFFDFGVKVS